jgi:hypothetical protein
VSRAPAHAGRLRPSEQFVFAAVFALMAAFVAVITMSAVRSADSPLFGSRAAAAGAKTVPAGIGGAADQAGQQDGSSSGIHSSSPRLSASLAAAMTDVRRTHPGQLAVGVLDQSTGKLALYYGTQHFSAGRVATADILAALLLRREHASGLPTGSEAVMATTMMTGTSNAATASLWQAVGRASGLASANRVLKLGQTTPGPDGRWDQMRTTVADQLQLLIDLTSSRSPLTGAAREYVLHLMTGTAIQPRRGVLAAGSGSAVQDGQLPVGSLWVANSMGIVVHGGHVLLIVVLSSGSSSRAAGIAFTSAAAAAAARVVTHVSS